MEKDVDLERLMHDIGTRISEVRRRRGWTQHQVADRVPMHLAQYRHIEQGRRDTLVGTLMRVSTALRVPLITLFRAPRSARPRARPRP